MSDNLEGKENNRLSLNDVAVFLIQLEPDDTSELASFREMLSTVADDMSYPEPSRQKIAQAVHLVGSLSDADAASQGADILDEVGTLIEAAMNAMDEHATEVPPEPAALPPPQEAHDSRDEPPESAPPDPTPAAGDASQVEIELPDDTDVELISAFIAESTELIAHAESALLTLEKSPQDTEAVNTVFRAFHNIKGTSAFFDLSLMTEIAHHAESLLSRIRDGEIRYAGGYAELSLRAMDMMKDLFRSLQNAMEGGPFLKPMYYDDMLRTLADPEKAGFSEENLVKVAAPEETPAAQEPTEEARDIAESAGEEAAEDQPPQAPEPEPEEDEAESPATQARADVSEPEADEPEPSEALATESEPEPEIQEPLPSVPEHEPAETTPPQAARPQYDEKPAHPAPVPEAAPAPSPPKPEPHIPEQPKSSQGNRKLIESSVRVPVNRLDQFIDMVGELVVAHSMVAQDEVVLRGDHHAFFKKVTQTSKIVRELQHMSMSMRMVPLKPTFRKMARLVRDLARKLDKNVTFATEGEDTEIDRNMVDIINDPLVHMVRNAVDHGIEPPAEREKLGKSPYGTVKLSAYHSAGDVVVKIEDDGKGFDREAIFEKAISRGLIGEGQDISATETRDRLRNLSDREVFGLIFEPGFSTAQVVSEVSGRGVGMDVVKKNIEKIRGQIEVQSEPGKGSVFKISIPLTLAIIDGMVVRVGSERYVMPTVSIVRSVRPKAADLSSVLRQGEMLSLQGRLIPIFRLSTLFGIQDAETDSTQAIVMVVEDDGRQAGVLVDELIGTQQIVIKTLGETMRNIPGISGSAIMPDGKVGLILDVGGLVGLATHNASH